VPYYNKVDELEVEISKANIKNVLEEMLKKEIISKQEFDAMLADDKNPGRFYSNFKVHKTHVHRRAPPVRPINSGCGSITEGIATYVEHHIKQSATLHDTYIQDTPDFLRFITHINNGPQLKTNAILVTWDVEGLFTNIVHKDGLHCLQEQLEERTQPKVPSEYLIKLMGLILHQNIFFFIS
jgi:hypothetical protein